MGTHTTPLFRLAVGPAASIAHQSAHETVTVADEGRRSVTVTSVAESYQRVHGVCVLTRSDGSHWLSISPRRFVLHPNQSRTVHVRVSVPHGARGQHDVLAAFTATAPGRGNVHVRGSVGSLLDMKLPGKSNACISLSSPHHAATGFPVGALVVFAVLALVLLLIVRRIVRRRHRNSHAR